jgi:hypothetical protein
MESMEFKIGFLLMSGKEENRKKGQDPAKAFFTYDRRMTGLNHEVRGLPFWLFLLRIGGQLC